MMHDLGGVTAINAKCLRNIVNAAVALDEGQVNQYLRRCR